MEDTNSKIKELPKKICHYREDCYRKNPVHFIEYSHPHLEKIFAKGINKTTNEYEIPDELFFSKEILLEQLKILEKNSPQLKIESKNDCNNTSLKNNTNENDNAVIEIKKNSNNENEVKTISNNKECLIISSEEETEDKRIPQKTNDIRKRKNINLDENAANNIVTPGPSNSSNLCKKQKINKNIHEYIRVVLPKGKMAEKLENAAPYNFFLTAITDSTETHTEPLTITFQEILDESLGELESSVQINFMVDVGWLLGHYYFAGCLDKPLLILHGDDTPELLKISEKKPQVTAIKINMSTPFSTHHTKLMLLGYKDGSMRVVISTANLYEDDWHNRTQGIWISPKLDALPENCDTSFGESPTEFRNDLMLYLVEYKLSKLQPWISRIRKSDFRSINVFFIGSVPGSFRESPQRGHPWGHARVGSLLSKHSAKINENCPIVAQSSNIGSLGQSVQTWVESNFGNSFRKDSAPIGLRRIPQFKMIYPSFGNVMNSYDGLLGGGCLPYGKKTNDKQLWLKNYLHQWKANVRHRSRAMPHIKTYCRWSDEGLYWFILTSANMSKAAWGSFNKISKIEPAFRINNYEAGVLFLPKFIIGEDTFPMNRERDGIPPFPIPYDIPLIPYGPDDTPFLMDNLM